MYKPIWSYTHTTNVYRVCSEIYLYRIYRILCIDILFYIFNDKLYNDDGRFTLFLQPIVFTNHFRHCSLVLNDAFLIGIHQYNIFVRLVERFLWSIYYQLCLRCYFTPTYPSFRALPVYHRPQSWQIKVSVLYDIVI